MVDRSEPQMPASRGRMRTQPGPGSSSGSMSASRSGPTAAPRPGAREPATWAAANRSGLRSKRSAFIAALLARSRQTGPIGSSGRGPPGAFSQCSTSQPRLRASAASRVSGLTATGKPTASSIGRSDVESA